MKKVVRSISGITPLAVIMKPMSCKHGKCIYCPHEDGIPESYTSTSPVSLRGLETNWDPKKQVIGRLRVLRIMGHDPQKIELIIMGGTFSDYPRDYQEKFIKECFDGMNEVDSKDLEEAKKINETTKQRCIGISVETRPDRINEEEIYRFLKMGITRVELGVQILDDENYKLTRRNHTVQDVVNATKLLKNSCFKITYHTMVGLPGSTPESDFENFEKIFNDDRFKPDHLKIYPTFVIKNTELEKMYNEGKFKPYSTKEIVNLLVKMKQIIPSYVRIMRIMRDIPAEHIVSECVYSHLRDEIQKEMRKLKVKCNCIRCRELGHAIRKGEEINEDSIKMKRIDYDSCGGKEIFLSFETNNYLISLLRLRINNKTGLIREIHTYSYQVPVGVKPGENEWQHRGYGKKLLKEAERISKEEFNCNKIIIISGVGVKEYFRKFGYKDDGPYVSKLS